MNKIARIKLLAVSILGMVFVVSLLTNSPADKLPFLY